MSKRTRQKNYQRGASVTTNRDLFTRLLDKRTITRPVDPRVDRRVFNPTSPRQIINVTNPIHPLKALYKDQVKKIKRAIVPVDLRGYDVARPAHWVMYPKETTVCLRRAMRRSVLFAERAKTGRGAGMRTDRMKDRKYNSDSTIKCRRK